MLRTISIKLLPTKSQALMLADLQSVYANACNNIANISQLHNQTNAIKLHHLAYFNTRDLFPKLNSQLITNAIKAVSQAYKSLISNNPKYKKQPLPIINFKNNKSVHYRTHNYTFKKEQLSLSTLNGRELFDIQLGEFQKEYLSKGITKEGKLTKKGNIYYFNLVIELPNTTPSILNTRVLGIDLGENNLAAISSINTEDKISKLYGGKQLRDSRDRYLNLRGRLQRNNTRSSKQLLRKVSGKESRHVSHINHIISKDIVSLAKDNNVSLITMENLTNIRKRIKFGKKLNSRLHRWSFAELQFDIEYKAENAGINIKYVNPAYTSKTCSCCGKIGIRDKHLFVCNVCGSKAHSDLNASLNIARLGSINILSTGYGVIPNVQLAKASIS